MLQKGDGPSDSLIAVPADCAIGIAESNKVHADCNGQRKPNDAPEALPEQGPPGCHRRDAPNIRPQQAETDRIKHEPQSDCVFPRDTYRKSDGYQRDPDKQLSEAKLKRSMMGHDYCLNFTQRRALPMVGLADAVSSDASQPRLTIDSTRVWRLELPARRPRSGSAASPYRRK
jgi:hypothetical protein